MNPCQAAFGLGLSLLVIPAAAEPPPSMEHMTVTARQSRAAWNNSDSPLGGTRRVVTLEENSIDIAGSASAPGDHEVAV